MAIWSLLLGPITEAVKLVATPVTDWLKHKQMVKEAQVKSKINIIKAETDARITKEMTEQGHQNAWELKSIDQASWKDEFWTIVLSIPAIMAFIPGMDGVVVNGFLALGGTPVWYQTMLTVAIGSAFGVRQFKQFMQLKVGKPPVNQDIAINRMEDEE